MTRFSTTTTTAVGGHTLTVMSRPDEAHDPAALAAVAALPQVLARSLDHLQRAVGLFNTRPNDPILRRLASQLFLTNPAGIAPNDLAHIMATLNLIIGGLNTDVTLKVGNAIGRNGRDPVGAVWMRLVDAAYTPRPYQNVMTVFDAHPHFWQSSHFVARMGAIRLTTRAVMDGDAIRALVHEASHKYAGTGDYRYLHHQNGVFQGIDRPMQSHYRALRNADSYGWLVQSITIVDVDRGI